MWTKMGLLKGILISTYDTGIGPKIYYRMKTVGLKTNDLRKATITVTI
jgi:hypothetical protein